MTRHPAVGSLSWLPLLIGLVVFTPSFGQFEAVPDKQDDKFEEAQESDQDPFGTSPDEVDSEDSDNSETATEPADSKPADVTTAESVPAPISQSNLNSDDKANASDNSENKGPAAKATTRQSAKAKPFEQRFWQYLQANNYANWAPAPGSSGDLYPGTSPHGDLLKIYMNRTAAGRPDDLPTGSVIVKENYNQDQQLLAITVMYRAAGYNPKSGNWYWVKYDADGKVARTSSDAGFKKLRGSVTSCIECHSDAGGGDFVFFNDEK